MNGSTGAIAPDCDQAHLTRAQHGPGTGTAASPWPLQTRLELAAQPTAPGVVRGHVRAVAYEWGLPGLADTAELLASDLASREHTLSIWSRWQVKPQVAGVRASGVTCGSPTMSGSRTRKRGS